VVFHGFFRENLLVVSQNSLTFPYFRDQSVVIALETLHKYTVSCSWMESKLIYTAPRQVCAPS